MPQGSPAWHPGKLGRWINQANDTMSMDLAGERHLNETRDPPAVWRAIEPGIDADSKSERKMKTQDVLTAVVLFYVFDHHLLDDEVFHST